MYLHLSTTTGFEAPLAVHAVNLSARTGPKTGSPSSFASDFDCEHMHPSFESSTSGTATTVLL